MLTIFCYNNSFPYLKFIQAEFLGRVILCCGEWPCCWGSFCKHWLALSIQQFQGGWYWLPLKTYPSVLPNGASPSSHQAPVPPWKSSQLYSSNSGWWLWHPLQFCIHIQDIHSVFNTGYTVLQSCIFTWADKTMTSIEQRNHYKLSCSKKAGSSWQSIRAQLYGSNSLYSEEVNYQISNY